MPQLQVRGTVPLQDLQGAELLLLLGKGPKDSRKNLSCKEKRVLMAIVMRPLPKGTHSYLAKTWSESMYHSGSQPF